MENEHSLFLYIFRTFRDSVKILIVKYEEWEIPQITITNNSSIDDTVPLISDHFGIHPVVVSQEFHESEGQKAISFFIFNSDPSLLNRCKDGENLFIEGRKGSVEWAHPRRLYKIASRMNHSKLYNKVLDWLIDQNFSTGFLINNLEKLR